MQTCPLQIVTAYLHWGSTQMQMIEIEEDLCCRQNHKYISSLYFLWTCSLTIWSKSSTAPVNWFFQHSNRRSKDRTQVLMGEAEFLKLGNKRQACTSHTKQKNTIIIKMETWGFSRMRSRLQDTGLVVALWSTFTLSTLQMDYIISKSKQIEKNSLSRTVTINIGSHMGKEVFLVSKWHGTERKLTNKMMADPFTCR